MNDLMKKLAVRASYAAQWSVFAGFGIFTAIMIFMPYQMNAAGVSSTAFYIALGIFAALTVSLVPPLFFKLPKRVKIASYIALLPAFIGVTATYGAMDSEYLKTPSGRAAAEKAAADEAVEAYRIRVQENRKNTESMFEAHEENVATMHRRVERCINWRGQIPSLVGAVKEALHNPRSFEHVATLVTSVGDTPAVTMEYRAENGFGALRTTTANAFISPDDCSVVALENVGKP